jgi:hypothetical protein
MDILLWSVQPELAKALLQVVENTRFALLIKNLQPGFFYSDHRTITPLWFRFWMENITADMLATGYSASFDLDHFDFLFVLVTSFLRIIGPRFGRPNYVDLFKSEVLVVEAKEEKQPLIFPVPFAPAYVMYIKSRSIDYEDPDRIEGYRWQGRLIIDNSVADLQRTLVALDLFRGRMQDALSARYSYRYQVVFKHRWHLLMGYVDELLNVPIARESIASTLQDIAGIPNDVSREIIAGYWTAQEAPEDVIMDALAGLPENISRLVGSYYTPLPYSRKQRRISRI